MCVNKISTGFSTCVYTSLTNQLNRQPFTEHRTNTLCYHAPTHSKTNKHINSLCSRLNDFIINRFICLKSINVHALQLHYTVNIDFWQYEVKGVETQYIVFKDE